MGVVLADVLEYFFAALCFYYVLIMSLSFPQLQPAKGTSLQLFLSHGSPGAQ